MGKELLSEYKQKILCELSSEYKNENKTKGKQKGLLIISHVANQSRQMPNSNKGILRPNE